jgi:hypothetical protein
LSYKGKILSNEKLIKDYGIENNNYIILVKKEEQKPIDNQSFSDNKEINPKEIGKAYAQIPDLLSFVDKWDIDKIDNYCRAMGFGSYSDLTGIEPQKYKECLKNPLFREFLKNNSKDASIFEKAFRNPKTQNRIQNYPFLKLCFQNPQKYLSPHNIQKSQNVFKVNENNIIESSNIGISIPPDPFESLNNNQNSQITNSSGQISNINSLNNNNTENKEIFGNNGIEIDYKKEFREQLSQLKDMGFTNEESNIQALKQSRGNINNAIENLLKYN